VVVRNQKTPYSCAASIRGYDRRSSKGFFLQTRTALLASEVGLDGPQGREHRLGSTTPCKPRSVPERLHKH